MIFTFIHPNFEGEPCEIHTGFEPECQRIGGYAAECGLSLYITSSYREPDDKLIGAIVEPANLSNHFIGHAIDMNPILNGKLYNSKAIAQFDSLPEPVQRFFGLIRSDPILRAGLDFKKPDEVHIDDGLNIRDPQRYVGLLENHNAILTALSQPELIYHS